MMVGIRIYSHQRGGLLELGRGEKILPLMLGEERDFCPHVLLLLCAQHGRSKEEIPRTKPAVVNLTS